MEELLSFTLNEKNKLITKEYVVNLLKHYDIHILITASDMLLFQTAMIHSSYTFAAVEDQLKQQIKRPLEMQAIKDPTKALPLQTDSYERLEFLGDSMIHAILADYIWTRYPGQQEGFMTRLRTKIEDSDTLAKLARYIGLQEYLIISRFFEFADARNMNNNIVEDSFEAMFGALYKTAGYDICYKFLRCLIEDKLDLAAILHTEKNFKDSLLQYFHKMRWADPEYGSLDVTGPENAKVYTMFIRQKINPRDDGQIVGYGHGSSKRKGEQEAARSALIRFGQLGDDESSDTCESIDD